MNEALEVGVNTQTMARTGKNSKEEPEQEMEDLRSESRNQHKDAEPQSSDTDLKAELRLPGQRDWRREPAFGQVTCLEAQL